MLLSASAVQNSSSPRFRPDFFKQQHFLRDDRAADRLVAHYVLERALSDRLRRASRAGRSLAYTEVYRELFTSLPDHPQRRVSPGGSVRVEAQLRRIDKLLRPLSVFLEIGCGDAALGFAAASQVHTVFGLDVTDALIDFASAPSNFGFLRTAGIEIPLPAGKVDFAYSNQLLEHLHPEDAADQLREVCRVLKPGGHYMCITPSRVSGPHDISCYFDYEATCLHLREYDYGSLRALFRDAGFQNFSCCASIRGREVRLPYAAIRALERSLLVLPAHIRANLTRASPVQAILGLNIIAEK
jgi:SAM-dependent methyltransferase